MIGDQEARPVSEVTGPVTDSFSKQASLILTLPVKKIRSDTKLHRVLSALLIRSYNRFEAARDLHDHALHSTASTIQNQYNIRVDRHDETVPGFGGAPTRVCRYWIESSQHKLAHQLLGITPDPRNNAEVA